MRIIDEQPFGFGWVQDELMQRASHALAAGDGGGVVLVDPVDDAALDDRLRALGPPAAVVQLLDRHDRDAAVIAARHGIPHHRLSRGAVAGTALEAVPVLDVPGWHERALWWPEHRVLLVAESVGSAPYYRAPDERVAVHPMLRLLPPARLARHAPEHLLFGHGAGIHDDATGALRDALAGSRRRSPAWLAARARELARRR